MTNQLTFRDLTKIKKYKNKKLYLNGRYINLSDVVQLIKDKKNIIIINHEGVDETVRVLKECLMTIDFSAQNLTNIIKLY